MAVSFTTGVSFFETMRGELSGVDGCAHALDFSVQVEASPVGGLIATGETRLSGVIHGGPWADHAPLVGRLVILPFPARRLTYDFTFADPDGEPLRLVGHKHLRFTRLAATMTTLHVKLKRADLTIASGVLRFDLAEGPALAASFWPSTSLRRLDLEASGDPPAAASTPAAAGLSVRDRATLTALCHAAIEAVGRVPAADAETVERALAQVAGLPAPSPALWWSALQAFDLAVRLRTGQAFADLSAESGRQLLGAWTAPGELRRGRSLRRVIDLLLAPILTGHFSRPDYLVAVGYPDHPQPRREPAARWMAQVTDSAALSADCRLEAEVVVVGTGAGGGAIAATLAERGVAVLIVEEGGLHGREAFHGDPGERMSRLYRDRGMTFTAGRPPISIPMGRMVGGTTAVNSGTCLRTPDGVLRSWREDLGMPAAFEPHTFAGWLDRVEAELGVAPSEARYLGRVATLIGDGADALGLEHGPLPRDAPGCDGQGTCILGCPTDAKRSSNVSWIPRALRAGAQLVTGLRATRILQRGRRAVGIEARGVDGHGVAHRVEIRADAVVISCGTLITPALLLDNGLRLPWLGRNLSLHPGMGVFGMMDAPIAPWNAVPQGCWMGGHGDPKLVFEGVYMPPHFAAANFPLTGAALGRWMDAHDRTAQFGFMVRDGGVGRVHRPIAGRSVIRYDLEEQSRVRLLRGAALLAEVMLRGGASEVMTGFGVRPVVRCIAEARALATAPVAALDFNLLGAHPLGTCRPGRSAQEGVVDFDHRVFGTDNIYVADGSTVPTSLGVNPQLTIMAMAMRAGESLAARLGN